MAATVPRSPANLLQPGRAVMRPIFGHDVTQMLHLDDQHPVAQFAAQATTGRQNRRPSTMLLSRQLGDKRPDACYGRPW
jgi:hypothetical protein